MSGYIDYQKWINWFSYYYRRPIQESADYHVAEPSFEPQKGFEEERPERVMIATEKEMDAARLKPRYRNYCAHTYMKLLQCKHLHPARHGVYCHHEKHDVVECEYEDIVIRMKEYERERRLQEREKRIQKKANVNEHME